MLVLLLLAALVAQAEQTMRASHPINGSDLSARWSRGAGAVDRAVNPY